MKAFLSFLALAAGVGVIIVFTRKPTLKHFRPKEFGPWWPMINNELLLKLDAFREAWGAPVVISPAKGGIGREHTGGQSQHDVTVWGQVNAIDVFPMVGNRYMSTESERLSAYQIAKDIGFTGIGLYTDTQPGNMLHLDVREDKTPGAPAKWSRVAGNYGAIGAVV